MKKHGFFLLLATLVAAPAWSAPFYVGLRAGSNLDGRLDNVGGNIDTDTPFGGYAGWRFHERFALEFAASNLGNSTRTAIADAGLDLDGALYQLGVHTTFPIADQFDLQAGVGAFRLDEDGEASTIAGPRRVDVSESGAYVDVGGRFRLNEQWSLRASYTWFDFDAGGDGNAWAGVQLDF